MILKDNYAIVENLQEYFFFYSMKTDGELFYVNRSLLMQTAQVTKQHVKEKLEVKEGDNYLWFQPCWLNKNNTIRHWNSLPLYGNDFRSRYLKKIKNVEDDCYVSVNILTINKTVKQLYELGKWCGLWE